VQLWIKNTDFHIKKEFLSSGTPFLFAPTVHLEDLKEVHSHPAPGSLSRILTMLASESANLTKIQSVPLIGKAWEYRFFIDFSVMNPAVLPATLQLLDVMTQDLKVLGVYKADKATMNACSDLSEVVTT